MQWLTNQKLHYDPAHQRVGGRQAQPSGDERTWLLEFMAGTSALGPTSVPELHAAFNHGTFVGSEKYYWQKCAMTSRSEQIDILFAFPTALPTVVLFVLKKRRISYTRRCVRLSTITTRVCCQLRQLSRRYVGHDSDHSITRTSRPVSTSDRHL